MKARLIVQGDGRPRLFVFRNCKNLIKEFGRYSWEKSPEGRSEKEMPAKVDDHALDALRYMVTEIEQPTIPDTWPAIPH